MTLQVIGGEAITTLIARLMEDARVVAPHRREGRDQWAFQDVKDPADVCLNYVSTVIPPKKYVLPQVEALVRYRLGEHPRMEPAVESEPLVIFGAHPCDIYGLCSLDIALSDNNADPNYHERRLNVRVVGVDCEPDEWCFCGSMGTASATEGYDLFLTPCGDGYIVEVATDPGAAMVEGLPLRDASMTEIGALKQRLMDKTRSGRAIHCDVSDLPLYFTGWAESPVWAKWAEKCYSCGTCNLTCPTCFCFDVMDRMDLSLQSGTRQREWDACMTEGFAKVASGENFREDPRSRLRHRFYRKYSYLFTRYGRPYCCGCGRCVRQCLTKIDPVGVINDLLAASGKGATVRG